jgi:hypothetical protein
MPNPAITVEALPAGYGDSILVACKLRSGVWRLLVDRPAAGLRAGDSWIQGNGGLRLRDQHQRRRETRRVSCPAVRAQDKTE